MKSVKLIIKQKIYFAIVLIASAVIISACNKDETKDVDPVNESLASNVEGTFTGTLKNTNTNQSRPATLTVTVLNDSVVTMHCIADNFDSSTTVRLYQNYDSIMVCYTGQNFYNQYGHNLNNNDFCNSMPNGWSNDWCNNNNNCWGGEDHWNAWTNHLNTQHNENDPHFGGFNTESMSCYYSFLVNNINTNHSELFEGTKNQ